MQRSLSSTHLGLATQERWSLTMKKHKKFVRAWLARAESIVFVWFKTEENHAWQITPDTLICLYWTSCLMRSQIRYSLSRRTVKVSLEDLLTTKLLTKPSDSTMTNSFHVCISKTLSSQFYKPDKIRCCTSRNSLSSIKCLLTQRTILETTFSK